MATEMERARASLDMAYAHFRAVLTESCRALIRAGFRPTVIDDPLRLEVMLEVMREEGVES